MAESVERFENNKMLQVLEWAYEKSVNGLPGTLSAEDLGEEYLKKMVEML